jgi:hypothetical protein
MTTNARLTSTSMSRRGIVALTLVAAAILGIAANSVVALAGIAAGASAAFAPLTLAVYAPFTVLGLVGGYVGWRIVTSRVSFPGRVMRILVPVLLVLSFLPDTICALVGFIPGGSITGYLALAVMHVVVVGVGVPVYQRLAPVR